MLRGRVILFAGSAMGEPSVEALYEQVRRLAPAAAGDAAPRLDAGCAGDSRACAADARRSRRRPTPTRTWSDPTGGPQLVVDPGSPYPDQQAVLDAVARGGGRCGRPLALVAAHAPSRRSRRRRGRARGAVGRSDRGARARPRAARRARSRSRASSPTARSSTPCGVTCVFTPGHADGHLCFEHRRRRSIAGDMVAGIGTILDRSERGRHGATTSRRSSALLARPRGDAAARARPGDRRMARPSCASTSRTARCARIASSRRSRRASGDARRARRRGRTPTRRRCCGRSPSGRCARTSTSSSRGQARASHGVSAGTMASRASPL